MFLLTNLLMDKQASRLSKEFLFAKSASSLEGTTLPVFSSVFTSIAAEFLKESNFEGSDAQKGWYSSFSGNLTKLLSTESIKSNDALVGESDSCPLKALNKSFSNKTPPLDSRSSLVQFT